jgi:peptide/nickel transport system substrate-binding protein
MLALTACSPAPDPNVLVMVIESSPTNLDPRVGIDAQSQRISELIFDDLLTRDAHLNLKPALAETWETPDPITYIFHLRHDVRFSDGRPLTSRDVKWTFDSLLQGKIRSTKAGAYRSVQSVEAPDDFTITFHLKEPFSTFLWNVSGSAMGVVPYGSGAEMSSHPIGSGPFRFVSAQLDKDVVLARNEKYWGEPAQVEGVRFNVVPDATTRALELRKGSADLASNAITTDTLLALEREPNLAIFRVPGTVLSYIAFNLRDPILSDVRVRQALAYTIDRRPMLEYLMRGFARPADSLLPPESWAYAPGMLYSHDPARARQLLDQVGYPEKNAVRFHLTMKTSTEESTRLLAAVLQQQLREVGIILDIRTFEFATFLSDVMRGEFQMYSLRWVGGNESPEIFEYVFDSGKFPPRGANRSFFNNPKVDALIANARRESNEEQRKQDYAGIQAIVAEQEPYVNLWYYDTVVVANRRVGNINLDPSGSYNFLRHATLSPQTRASLH